MNVNISAENLREAASVKLEIEKLTERLNKLLGGETVAKSGVSDSGRAKIAAAQRKRWKNFHASKQAASAPATEPTPATVTPV
jgi:hypothetical protein